MQMSKKEIVAATFPSDEDDGVSISSIKTEGWPSTEESATGGVVSPSSFTLDLCLRLFLRPKIL